MDIQAAIRTVTEGRDLSREDMTAVMQCIMTGEATQAQIGGFLVGLRMKGETVDEIAAAAGVMRDLATRVKVDDPHLIDTCGTGGDGLSTFNISTACAFVAAAAGAKVAKHGNRSITSKSGSADVLEAAGVNLDLTADQIAHCINEVGLGFMFAPKHHSAMKYAIGPRKEMGVLTIFNILGPLTNPAGARNQILGVFSNDWLEPLVQVLGKLGSDHVFAVHADDGMDEISINAPTQVAELKAGTVKQYTITPERFGLQRGDIKALVVESAEQSLQMIHSVLDGKPGAAHDIVLLNAGAAIYTSGLAQTHEEGVAKAAEVINTGAARAKLDALVEVSNNL